MPGDKRDVIPERPQALGDRADEGGVIAAREVGAANRALKQDIADESDLTL
jgi:hypothetical protein